MKYSPDKPVWFENRHQTCLRNQTTPHSSDLTVPKHPKRQHTHVKREANRFLQWSSDEYMDFKDLIINYEDQPYLVIEELDEVLGEGGVIVDNI